MKPYTMLFLAAMCGILANCSALGPEVSGNPPSCPQDGLAMTVSAAVYLCPNGHVAHNVGGLPSLGAKASKKALEGAPQPLPVVSDRNALGQYITPKWHGVAPTWLAKVWQSPSGEVYQSPWVKIKP